jgi:hypothetical protein
MGVVRWVLRIVGVLALLAGVAGLVVGREGTIWSPVTAVRAPAGQPVLTSSGVTAFAGGTLVVEATVPQGSVLVGVAHPVDVASWVDEATHRVITQVGPGGVSTHLVTREAVAPQVPAASARFWSAVAGGGRSETLRVPLDGAPTQVAVATSEAEQVEIRLGLVTPALPSLSTGALVLGGFLIGLSFLRRRRPALHDGAEAVQSRGILLAVALLPLLGGRGVVPERVAAWDLGEVTKPSLTAAEAPALFEDYDRRNNAAIIATAKAGDPRAWATADSEVMLDHDQFSTHLASLRKDKTVHGAMTHTADQIWAPEFAQYPMYAMTSSTLAVTGEKAPAPEYRRVSLWLRSSSTASWLLAGSAGATTALPQPLPAGDQVTPGAEDRALAEAGAEAIMTYLRTAKPGTVTADPALSRLATGEGAGGGPGNQVAVTWWNQGVDEQVGAEGSVRAVRAEGGVLAHASLVGKQSFSVSEREALSWDDPAYAKALGQPGSRRVLSRDIGVSVFYLVAADGRVRVLASNWDVVR